MMKIRYILYQILIISNFCFSQTNLVSNPSFENHTSCPTFMLQWDKCVGWLNCNGNVGNGLWGTPDYFHTCGTTSIPYNPVPPNTGNGFCNPHTGSAMMGLVCYNPPYPNYREYISTQLNCPMVSGNTYTVSFWIVASSAPTVKYNSSHFGVYLSGTYPVQTTYLVMNYIPQYEITSVINNTTWQQHTFTITPTSNLNYITLGCFRNESTVTSVLATPSAGQPYSNYFIDDIEVLSSASSGTVSGSATVTNVTCFGAANGSATVAAGGTGNNYLWSPGNYTTSTVSNLSAGVYTVSINSGSCSSSTLAVTVSQPTAALTSSISSITPSICIGQSAILNSTNVGGTPSYTVNWSNGTMNTTSISVNPNSTSVYSYTVTDSNLCTKTSSFSIIVSPTPTININSQNICSGVTSTLNVNGANSYTWLPGNISGNTNIVSLTTPTTFTVIGSSGSCSVASIFTIGVNSTPTLTVNSISICEGQSATLFATSTSNNYTWLPQGQTTSSISISPNATTNYSVSSSIGSCSSIAIATVIVNASPSLITTNSVTACLGQTTVLSAFGANTYTWLPANITGSTFSISPLSNTQYTVFGESNGCLSSTTVQVNIANTLTVNINSLIICEGQSALLIANTNGNQFHWEPSSLAATPNNSSTFVNPTSATVFTFETSYNGNCVTTVTTNVIVNDKPDVFAGNDTIISIGEPFVLTGYSDYNFGWQAIDGSTLDCNYCSSVTVNPQQNTCYVLVSNTNQGCKSTDTICITVDKDWSIYIPNAFTPNNDTKNDLFLPYGYGIESYELYIFDRWGEQIFKSDEDHRGWNGFYKNEICEMGVYTYMLIINTFSKQEQKKIGHVTLLQ